ncbi:hypothetical protein KEM54_000755 [Ascosphaera aggregata]|nr:hypothetical protein KEM54_000755 [Ascosphaera aggregata]
MRFSTSSMTLALLAHISYYITPATSHSWVSFVRNINSANGQTFGEGYPRGYVSRAQWAAEGGVSRFGAYDVLNMYAPASAKGTLPPSAPLCKNTQQSENYTEYGGKRYGPIEAAPDSWLALFYQDNGHVTNPSLQQGKQRGGGHVFVYGSPKFDPSRTFQEIWDSEAHNFTQPKNSNGDLQLLAIRNFDDGVCRQGSQNNAITRLRDKKYPNNKQDAAQQGDVYCQSDFRLPGNIKDMYTIYWIWNWPSYKQGPHGEETSISHDEVYVSCLDVHVAASGTRPNDEGSQIEWKSAPYWNDLSRPDQVTITNPTVVPSVPCTPSPIS